MPKLKLEPLTVIAGGAAAIATAITAPQFVGAPLACIGGVFAGSAAIERRETKRNESKETSARVSGAFSAMYERNRGLVDPTELSFIANISVNQSHGFLTSLAESTGGSKVPHKNGVGVLFNFPHSASVLDELSKNAQDWVSSQTAELNQQLEAHRQALRAAQLAQATMPAQQIRDVNDNAWN